jgi:hypothetical protein
MISPGLVSLFWPSMIRKCAEGAAHTGIFVW